MSALDMKWYLLSIFAISLMLAAFKVSLVSGPRCISLNK